MKESDNFIKEGKTIIITVAEMPKQFLTPMVLLHLGRRVNYLGDASIGHTKIPSSFHVGLVLRVGSN